jgi:hypothetical protein
VYRKIETKREVLDLIAQYEQCGWFSRVGQFNVPMADIGIPWKQISSWEEATSVMEKKSTDDFLVDTRNELFREKTKRRDGVDEMGYLSTQFNEWVAGYSTVTRQIAEAAASIAPNQGVVRGQLETLTRSIVIMSLVLCQYNDVVQAHREYEIMSRLLLSGRCVAGWEGDYPVGHLVVY